MEFFEKAFNWLADLSAKLPKVDFEIFFIVVAAIIFGLGIVFAFTYLGSKSYKLIKASKKIQKYLDGVDTIDDDNVSDFTAHCFSAKAPQALRDSWVQYLGVRFGYPSDIVSDKNVYDKTVKKNKDYRSGIYICVSLIVLAIFAFWGYGTLDAVSIGTAHFVSLVVMGVMHLFLILINRGQNKRCLEVFDAMQEDLDAKVNLQVEKNYATDSSPLSELAGMVEEIIARNTSKAIDIDEDDPTLVEPTPIEALIEQEEQNAEPKVIPLTEVEDVPEETAEDEQEEPVEVEEDEAEQPEAETIVEIPTQEAVEEEAQTTEEPQENTEEPQEVCEEEDSEEGELEQDEEAEEEPVYEESVEEAEPVQEQDVQEEIEEPVEDIVEDEVLDEQSETSEEIGEYPSEEDVDEDSQEVEETEEVQEEASEEDMPESVDEQEDTIDDSQDDEQDDAIEEEEEQEVEDEQEISDEEQAEPEVVYVVDGEEDDEEVVKPAKLVKLPNLVDYMLSKNMPKAMKLQIASMLIATYKKFENSNEDRKIVVQCLTKVMKDLQENK